MSGLLNKAITTGAIQLVGTVPVGAARSLIDILVVNPTAATAAVQVWISSQVAPTEVDLIEPNALLEATGGRVEYNCINCSAGEKIFVKAPVGLVVRVTNLDEV